MALHMAAAAGDLEAVKLLHAYSADCCARDRVRSHILINYSLNVAKILTCRQSGDTALMVAARRGHLRLVKYLAELPAPERPATAPLHVHVEPPIGRLVATTSGAECAESGARDSLLIPADDTASSACDTSDGRAELCSRGRERSSSSSASNALFASQDPLAGGALQPAARAPHTQTSLAERINASNADGETALHVAALHTRRRVVEYLCVQHGVALDVPNQVRAA